MQHLVLGPLKFDLCADEHFDKLELVVQAFILSGVGVFEVVSLQVQTWSPSHDICDHLHKPLLLEWIHDVLIALNIGQAKLHFFEVESGFAFKQVRESLKTVLRWLWLL